MRDRIIQQGGCWIQYGPLNQRVYLMKLDPAELPAILDILENLAETGGYGKLFARIPQSAVSAFLSRGYRMEARIPGLFQGSEAGCFMAKYPRPARAKERQPERIRDILEKAGASSGANRKRPAVDVRACAPAEAPEISRLYAKVFASYPFPVYDPAYIQATMAEHLRYYCVRSGDQPVAVASAEMDAQGGNAEMTDFATLPDWRGRGLASALLARMEREMAAETMKTVYTIARSLSPGMNRVFARAGYDFAGTLINNTHIAGEIQSMNVWFKRLSP